MSDTNPGQGAPLVSTSPADQSSANGSNAVALAAVTIGVWVASLFGVDVPATVVAAASVLLAAIVHAVAVKLFLTPTTTGPTS